MSVVRFMQSFQNEIEERGFMLSEISSRDLIRVCKEIAQDDPQARLRMIECAANITDDPKFASAIRKACRS